MKSRHHLTAGENINEEEKLYGFDGNTGPLEWADLFGLGSLNERDQKQLVEDGYFTTDGHRILSKDEILGECIGICIPNGKKPRS